MKIGMTLDEMSAEVMRQSRALADYSVSTANLEMEANGPDVVLRMFDDARSDAVEPMDVNPIAHRQIGTHLGIPAKYYDVMREKDPVLLSQNVNAWFSREPSRRMLRTLDGRARAFLSNRYRRIDNLEILQAVLPVLADIPDVRFESCNITGERMYIKAINPRLQTEVTVGDVVQAGIMISNSEIGLGAVNIQPLVLRLVCMNGMTVNDARTRRNHVGRVNDSEENYMLYTDKTLQADDYTFLLKVQDTVRAAVDETKFQMVVDKMREAAGAVITARDIPGVVKLAGKDFGLSEGEGTGVLNHLITDGDLSLYGLSNAVTRYSQDVESYDRATELESIGYEILTMPMPQWSRLNQAALPVAA